MCLLPGDCVSFHFEEVDGAGWRMILLPIRPNWPACPKKGRLWSGSWGAKSTYSPPHVLNYVIGMSLRSTPERTSPGPKIKIKIKMMNRSMSEAPSQPMLVRGKYVKMIISIFIHVKISKVQKSLLFLRPSFNLLRTLRLSNRLQITQLTCHWCIQPNKN